MLSAHNLCFVCSLTVGIMLLTPLAAGPASSLAELKVLRIGMLQGIDSLNPFIAYEDSSYVILFNIYDRLITYDEDLNPRPLIATSWEVDSWDEVDNPATPDINEGANRLWRYHIAQNVKWHDGEALTVDDVAYSINVNLNESMWAFTPYISIRTAEYARAINSTTVEVYLRIPNIHVDNLMLPIVPEHIWSQYTVGEIQNSVVNAHPIGSGPLKFVQYAPNEYVVLDRNPNYHLGPVKYDRVVFQFYGSDQVMAMDLMKGNIDLARFPPQTYNSLKGKPNIETAECKRVYQQTIGFNCFNDPASKGNPLMLDENIRRAMHLALNKQYIIDTVWAGYGDVGYGLPAPIVPYYHWEPQTPEESLNFNLTRANAMLDAAGYDKWSGGVRLVNRSDNPYASYGTPLSFKFLVRNDAPEDLAAAPYVKEMWKEIGVSVDILPVDESVLEDEVMWAASHDVFMWYWSGDFDPTYLLAIHTTDQIWGWSDTFWSNATYDALFLLQMQQTGEERRQTVFEMQKMWYEASPMIIVTYPYDLFAWYTGHFTNWGDPAAHPGRTMTPYFGANPLFLGLEPVGGAEGGAVDPMALLVLVAIVAIVVVLIAILIFRRRKTEGSGETE